MHNRWLTSRAIRLHLIALVVVGVCLALGWWQLHRALDDHNRLSWAYTFEWPFFAAYAGWVWWRLLREEPGFASTEARDSGREPASVTDEAQAKELEAYNRYLASLSTADRRSKE